VLSPADGRNGAVGRAPDGDVLTLPAFLRLAGRASGYSYLKLVVDRGESAIHYLDSAEGVLHVQYVARCILGMTIDELAGRLDAFNDEVYRDPDRRFYLGTLALHSRDGDRFLALETVDVDTMSRDMLRFFYRFVRERVDRSLPLFLKPANHLQEEYLDELPADEIPRVLPHEIYSAAGFVPLTAGAGRGRLRVFRSEGEYRRAAEPPGRHDILVMPRVPEDVPRVAGLIHAEHTAPLSHVNILAAGWRIPAAISIGAVDRFVDAGLDGHWVDFVVDPDATDVRLLPAGRPDRPDGPDGPDRFGRPAVPIVSTAPKVPSFERVTVPEPDLTPTHIVSLADLRSADRTSFGTKAANLGELTALLRDGSPRWLDYYRVPRPPRLNLLRYLARQLEVQELDEDVLLSATARLVNDHARVPRGIALPFSAQRRFHESSPEIRGSLAALENGLDTADPDIAVLCDAAQRAIRTAALPEDVRGEIEQAIGEHLPGASPYVVRSSSNAEDLAGFSAAGLYHSVVGVPTADAVVDAVKEVWASMVSARAVLLRRQAGIPVRRCFMSAIVQEQVHAEVGGVVVTCDPLNPRDFRTVSVNASPRSTTDVVTGRTSPIHYLCNTVEGGSRTVSLGSAATDLDAATKTVVRRLALISRLLQSHFAADGTPNGPVDIEWAIQGGRIHLLQVRPFPASG
jgi:hypothetical protein